MLGHLRLVSGIQIKMSRCQILAPRCSPCPASAVRRKPREFSQTGCGPALNTATVPASVNLCGQHRVCVGCLQLRGHLSVHEASSTTSGLRLVKRDEL